MALLFITGVPKAGKTSLAYRLHLGYFNCRTVILDGDELRDAIGYKGFTKEDRDRWLEIVSNLAKTFEDQGVTPIVALVSPFSEARNKFREKFRNSKLVWLKYDQKYMWEGSVYEEPTSLEDPLIIERKDGVEYGIPQELVQWIDEVE